MVSAIENRHAFICAAGFKSLEICLLLRARTLHAQGMRKKERKRM
jgi:hypothetical protein